MSLKVIGDTMIFKSEYGYTTTISNKNINGEYEKMYIQVQFPKGIELENKTKIKIVSSFLSFYKTKDGMPKLKLVVQDFRTEEDMQKIEENYAKEEREAIQNEDSFVDLELPF